MTTRPAPAADLVLLGRARVPDVLADGQADERAVDLDQGRLGARARSSGARRRRRSWADRTCGRSRRPRRRPARPASCRPGEGEGRSAGRSPRARRLTAPCAPESRPARRSPPPPRRVRRAPRRTASRKSRAQDEVLRRVAGETELGQQHELRAARPGPDRSTPRSGASCPRCRPRSGRSGRAPGADGSTRPCTQYGFIRRAGLPCRACSGRIGPLASAEAWS